MQAPPWRPGPWSNLLNSSSSVHSRGKTLVFPQLRLFLALQWFCPTNFCKEMNFLLMQMLKNLKQLSMLQLFPCPGTIPAPNCWPSCQTTCSVVPPLHRPYNGPYAVLRCGPCSFTIRVGSWDKIISDSRLKACTEADATPGSPQCSGGLSGNRPGGPAAPSGSRFQNRWFLHLPLLRCCKATVQEPFFWSWTGFLHTLDWWRHPSLHSSGIHAGSGIHTGSGHRLRD